MDETITWEEVIEAIMGLSKEINWDWILVKSSDGDIVGMYLGNEEFMNKKKKEKPVTRLH